MIKKFLEDNFKNEVLGKGKDRNFFWSFVVYDYELCQGYFGCEY